MTKIWMAVHPNGARTELTTATDWKSAIQTCANVFGLDCFSRGLTIEHGGRELMDMRLCDFCCNAKAEWLYPCEAFRLGLPETGALGIEHVAEMSDDWLACTECHDVYEGGGREALITRAVQFLMERHPDLTAEMLTDRTRPAYEQFEFMRRGEPEKL